MLVATAVGTVDMVLLMGGKSSWNLFNTVVALSSNIVLNLLLIPRYGGTGAAIAWSSSIIFTNLLPLGQVWKFLGMHPFGRGFPKVVARRRRRLRRARARVPGRRSGRRCRSSSPTRRWPGSCTWRCSGATGQSLQLDTLLGELKRKNRRQRKASAAN